jgi:hypothetical protein
MDAGTPLSICLSSYSPTALCGPRQPAKVLVAIEYCHMVIIAKIPVKEWLMFGGEYSRVWCRGNFNSLRDIWRTAPSMGLCSVPQNSS